MIRGIYTSAASMMAEMIRTDVTANNLANANTAGFKKDTAVNKEFNSLLIQRINDGAKTPIGNLGVGALVDEIDTIHTQGVMRQTGNKLDVAIEGNGFFVIQTPNGFRYTRNGTFNLSATGELVNGDGYRVMGQQGPVSLNDGARIDISPDGRVLVDDTEVDSLRVVDFPDHKKLAKEGSSLFDAPGGDQPQPAAGFQLRQGFLELSNVNVVAEMISLINNYRAYEINGKAVQSHDQLVDKAVNEVGRV